MQHGVSDTQFLRAHGKSEVLGIFKCPKSNVIDDICAPFENTVPKCHEPSFAGALILISHNGHTQRTCLSPPSVLPQLRWLNDCDFGDQSAMVR